MTLFDLVTVLDDSFLLEGGSRIIVTDTSINYTTTFFTVEDMIGGSSNWKVNTIRFIDSSVGGRAELRITVEPKEERLPNND